MISKALKVFPVREREFQEFKEAADNYEELKKIVKYTNPIELLKKFNEEHNKFQGR